MGGSGVNIHNIGINLKTRNCKQYLIWTVFFGGSRRKRRIAKRVLLIFWQYAKVSDPHGVDVCEYDT